MGVRRPLRVLITAGPTREPIDPVRYLSNYSTGYMGSRLAAECLRRGHQVTVVSGPGREALPSRARVILVERTEEMERAVRTQAPRTDVVVMAAAVSDFRVARLATAKLPRSTRLTLRLEATPDLIGRLPRRRSQLIVGFALESRDVVARARRKLREKRLDLLLAQRADHRAMPFGRRHVQAWLLGSDGEARALGRLSKSDVARVLLDKIEALWYGQHQPGIN